MLLDKSTKVDATDFKSKSVAAVDLTKSPRASYMKRPIRGTQQVFYIVLKFDD